MKKREAKRLFRKSLKYWLVWTGLGVWDIKTTYYVGRIPDEPATVAAVCYPYWKYLYARVSVNLDVIKDMTAKEIDEVALHELCHCILDEMCEGEMHHEERVATMMQKAFTWVRGEK